MYCIKCVNEVDENAEFCNHCGADLKKIEDNSKQNNVRNQLNGTYKKIKDFILKYKKIILIVLAAIIIAISAIIVIDKLIDSIECINDLRKQFYKRMYRERYEKILKPAYEKLV